jgi:CRISPR-associated protein Cas2
MLWVACYDIADDERRAAACAVLLKYGRRVQYSVFECHLTAYRRGRLGAELRDLLDPATDSLRFYPQCAWCAQERRMLGTALATVDAGFEVY